jgi:hypothetical protein
MSEPEITTNTPAVDLSDLKLMPSWVANFGQETPAKQRYSDSDGADRPQRGGRGDRFSKGARPSGERRFGGGGDRGGERRDRFGGGGAGGPPRERREGGFGGKGGGGKFERRGGGPRGGRRDDRDRGFDRPERAPLPTDIVVSIETDERAAEMLAAHIRSMGRAFSMFDASRLVLADGARFHVKFKCAEERVSGLFQIPGDANIFLTREEAVAHILNSGALTEYYRADEVELEEPKGNFQSIGVCGMSGTLLGPPSHHSYQAAIMRLHRERFANLPLDEYKRRVRVESNPDLVTQWKEQQKKGTRWVYLKEETIEGQEPKAFTSRAEVEAHFRRTHADSAVIEVREAVVPGGVSGKSLSHVLLILLRKAVDFARNHLFDFSQRLGHALEHRGLKLFKRRSGKLFVSRVRPRAIDPSVIFSEPLAKIVEIVKAQPGILISKVVEILAPGPAPAAGDDAATSAAPSSPNPEQIAVTRDLRWLADEGYIIEYSDGAVFLGVQGEKAEAEKKASANPVADEVASKDEAETLEAEEAASDATELPTTDAKVEDSAENSAVKAEEDQAS